MAKLTTTTELSAAVIASTRELRSARGWSTDRLARELAKVGVPVSGQALRNQESRASRGQVPAISVDQAIGLARVFQMPVEDLIVKPCSGCAGSPPRGFTCNECGKSA